MTTRESRVSLYEKEGTLMLSRGTWTGSNFSLTVSRASCTGFASKGNLGDEADSFQDPGIPEPLHPFIIVEHLIRRRVKIISSEDLDSEADIGKGAFMQVRRGTLGIVDMTTVDYYDVPVAIKSVVRTSLPIYHHPQHAEQYQRYKEAIDSILLEIDVIAHDPLCHHRNIIRLLGVLLEVNPGHVDSKGKMVILPKLVTELAFSDLATFYERGDYKGRESPQDLALRLIADIADGITAIHSYGIVHADLKPANILLFRDNKAEIIAKIGDFGIRGVGIRAEEPGGGTWRWNAPEYIDDRLYSRPPQHAPRDVYAFGLILGYLALEGCFPLRGNANEINAIKTNPSDNALSSIIDQITGKFPPVLNQVIADLLSDTVRADWRKRVESLEHVREQLFSGSDVYQALGNPVHSATITPLESLQAQSLAQDNSGELFLAGFTRFPQDIRGLIEKESAVFPPVSERNRARNLTIAQIRGEDPESLSFLSKLWAGQVDVTTSSSLTQEEPFSRVWYKNIKHDLVNAMIEGQSPDKIRERLITTPSLYIVDEKWTAAHFAVITPRPAYLKMFYDLGHDIDSPAGPLHHTPLYLAVAVRSLDFVDALLNLGVNVNGRFLNDANSDGVTLESTITPLFAALRLGYYIAGKSDAIIRRLLAAGASVEDRVLPYGDTCLHLAARAGPTALAAILDSSTSARNYINSKNSNGETPLFMAIKKQDAKAARSLLEQGARVDIQDNEGNTPYHAAISNLSPFVVGSIWSQHKMTSQEIMEYEEKAKAVCQLLVDYGAEAINAEEPAETMGIDTRLVAKYVRDATARMDKGDPLAIREDIDQCVLEGEVVLTHNKLTASSEGSVHKIDINQFPSLYKLHDGFMCKMRRCRNPHRYMLVDPSTCLSWKCPIRRAGSLYILLRIGRMSHATDPIHIDACLHDVTTDQTNEPYWHKRLDLTILCPKENTIYEINIGKISLTRAQHFIFKLELGDRAIGLLIEWVHIVRRKTEPLLNEPVDAAEVSNSQEILRLLSQ